MFRLRGVRGGAAPFLAAAAVWLGVTASAAASASELRDGTSVPVRLVGAIDSETARPGQRLRFVVTANVVSDGGETLIQRNTAVNGVVTDARRARWGFSNRQPRLAFAFTLTTARDGQIVRLRASVRVESGGKAQLQLRVDRADGKLGFFDNMGDRPITSSTWTACG